MGGRSLALGTFDRPFGELGPLFVVFWPLWGKLNGLRGVVSDMPSLDRSWYLRPMEASALAHRLYLTARRTLSHRASSLVLSLVALGAAVGCDEPKAEAAPEAEAVPSPDTALQPQSTKPEVAAEGAADQPAAAAGKAAYDEDAFGLSITPPEKVVVGTPLSFKVILKAKSGYKVNDEYPIKFELAATSGVKAEKSVLRKEDAKLEKTQAEFPVLVTLEAAGPAEVSGKLSFSVCTEERCLIEKRELTVKVTAS